MNDNAITYRMFFESPTSTQWDSDEYDNPIKNQNKANIFKQTGKFVEKYKNLYDIYRFVGRRSIYDAFIDSENKVKLYFSYTVDSNIIESGNVWQDPSLKGMCREVIFDYYLIRYGGIKSDTRHTTKGKMYWKKLIMEALRRNYTVSVENLETKTSMLFTDISEFENYYGFDKTATSNRFLIKKK